MRRRSPTIAETYPGFDVIAFNAVVAPAGMPAPVLDKLSADIRAVVNSTEFAEKTSNLGIFPLGNTPQGARRLDARADRALEGDRQGGEHQGRIGHDRSSNAIDCDVHPTVPSVTALLPYLDDFWRDTRAWSAVSNSLESDHLSAQCADHVARRNGAARTADAATERGGSSRPGARPLAAAIAILNCLYGVQPPLQRGHGGGVLRARSTTGSPGNGSTAIRGCAPRS